MRPLVAFLHGFLGRASDWRRWSQGFENAWCPELLQPGALDPHCPLHLWGERFNQLARQRGKPCLLVGYSLGGRLAMHALAAPDSPWQAGLLVSAHPGLSDPEQIAARRRWDAAWARRFRSEPWPEVLQAWDAQPIFSGSSPVARADEGFNRDLLARALETWSPTRHQLADGTLQTRPLTWCCGALDSKYAALYAKLPKEGLPWQQICLSSAGHRLPWDLPEDFGRLLDQAWQRRF